MVIDKQFSKTSYDGTAHIATYSSLALGAQNGYVPKLGGTDGNKKFSEWVSAAPKMEKQIYAIPLYAPGFLDIVASGSTALELKKIWADIFSVHPKTITGLTSQIKMETADIQIGKSGALFLEDDIRVTQERSTLSYGYDERMGDSIGKFMDFCIRYTAGNENTQVPQITQVPGFAEKLKAGSWSLDMKAGTVLYVIMDPLNVKVEHAWLVGNVRNKEGGKWEGKFDIASGSTLKQLEVPCTSMAESGEYINAYAQEVVDKMGIFNVDPTVDMDVWANADEASVIEEAKGGFNAGEGFR